MKLHPYLYHLNTFNIRTNDGVSELVGGWRNQKTTRKCHEIKRISTLTSSKTSLQNAKEMENFSMPSITM